jgi:bacteriocin biosynthesis cyclodehydratase domain-containing protein
MLPGTDHLVAGVAAAEAVKFLIGIDRGALVDAIVRIHLRTLEWDRVDVLTVPRCPACSGVSVASA